MSFDTKKVTDRFSIKRSNGQVLVYDQGHHVSVMPEKDWDLDGARMIECWTAGVAYDPRVEFAGQMVTSEVRAERRIQLLEKGGNATRQVDDWTRYLAASEAREGGVLGGALNAVLAEQWPALVRELYDSLYTPEPKPLETPAVGAEWISELVTQAEGSPEWSALREQVAGDQWATGIAAGRVAHNLAEKAQELLEKLPKEDPQRLADDAKATEEILGPEAPATVQAHEHASKAAEQAAAVLNELVEFEGRAEPEDPSVGYVLAQAAKEAGEEVEAVLMSSGSMADLSSGALKSTKAAPETMRRLLASNPNLRKLVELAGRLRIRARAKQRTKTKYVPESIVDVTIGGEVERLLPVELGQLLMPETELLLLRKIHEREALQYDLEGEETLDRGPIIVAVDSSGSMQGIRNQWAMAVAIAVLEIAAMQRRPFVLMHFDGRVQATFEVLKPAALTLVQLVEMVSFFSGGGTDFSAPLSAAHKIITRDGGKAGVFAKADVMLVTDGQAGWGTWPEQVKATGASLYGVAIDTTFSPAMAAQLTGLAQVAGPALHDASANVDLLFGILMPVEEVSIEDVKKGVQVVDPFSGTLVTVRKTRIDGDFVVLEIGEAFCLELRRERGSVIGVWRRRRRKERKEDGEK